MGATDIAKDAIRIASTAGLSKDVIDLLNEKITLLDGKIADLESENAELKEKIKELKAQSVSESHLPNSLDTPTLLVLYALGNNPAGLDVSAIGRKSNQMSEENVKALLEEFAEWGILNRKEDGIFRLNSVGRTYFRKIDQKEYGS